MRSMNQYKNSYRFDITCEELDAFKEGECPVNMAKNTEWALKNFEEWRIARSRKYYTEQCPLRILMNCVIGSASLLQKLVKLMVLLGV